MLLKHIRAIHAESRGTYGWPRVHAELTLGLGLPVNRKRVARLMRRAGLQGLYRRRRHGCTVRNPAAEPAGDLVNRQFTSTSRIVYGSPISPNTRPEEGKVAWTWSTTSATAS